MTWPKKVSQSTKRLEDKVQKAQTKVVPFYGLKVPSQQENFHQQLLASFSQTSGSESVPLENAQLP